jgi:membrane protease YdiL (CAAX protease family)
MRISEKIPKPHRAPSAYREDSLVKLTRDSIVTPLVFSVLVCALGWVGRLVIDPAVPPSPSGTPGKLLWILAPALLALAFRRFDPAVRGARLFAFKPRALVMAAKVAGFTVLAVSAVIAIGFAAGALTFDSVTASASTLAPVAVSIVLFAFLEESAWRGYLLPALLARTNYAVMIAIASVTWWAWHLPYLDQLMAVFTTEPMTSAAPRLFLGVVAMQILYSEVFLRCRSVWPAVAMHATFNLVANITFLLGVAVVGARPWLLSPSADSVLMIVVTAAVGVWLYRRRIAAGATAATGGTPATSGTPATGMGRNR